MQYQVKSRTRSRLLSWWISIPLSLAMVGAFVGGCGTDRRPPADTGNGAGGGAGAPGEVGSPDTVLGVTFTSDTDGIHFEWREGTAGSEYEVYRCPVPAGVVNDVCAGIDPAECTLIGTSSTSSYSDAPPPAPQAFCYSVRACIDDDSERACGGFSEVVPAARKREIPERFIEGFIADDGRHVYGGQTATLHAFLKNAEVAVGDVVYEWSQIGGDKVTGLTGADTESIQFTVPDRPQTLSFKLTVRDDKGIESSSKAAVWVKDKDEAVIVSTGDPNAVRVVVAGGPASLHVQATSAMLPLSYEWTQLQPDPNVLPIALTGKNTDNPTFTVPDIVNTPDGKPFTGQLAFEVRVTDAAGHVGRSQVKLLVVTPAPTTNSPDALVPNLRPTNVPLKIKIPTPVAQRKPFLIWPIPTTSNVAGAEETLAVLAFDGLEPYSYEWSQVSGSKATFETGTDVAAPRITLPNVTSPENLDFKVTVTDDNGDSLTAKVSVIVTLPIGDPPTGDVPVPELVQTLPLIAIAAETQQDLVVPLNGIKLLQVQGPQTKVVGWTTLADGIHTRIRFEAPNINEFVDMAQFEITGEDRTGVTRTVIQSLEIVRVPSKSPPMVPPTPVVAPSRVPPIRRLALALPSSARADEGQAQVQLGVGVSGGVAPYAFTWTYDKGMGDPDVTLTGGDTRTPSVSLQGVDVSADTELSFKVSVESTDGQVVEIRVPLQVTDTTPAGVPDPDPLLVSTLNPMTVLAGHDTYVHAPTPIGGLPPYTLELSQKGGSTVTVTEPFAGVWKLSNLPALGATVQSEDLEFEFTIKDSHNGEVHVRQTVTVVNQLKQLLAEFAGPVALVNNGDQLQLLGIAGGGTAPYSYAWTVTPQGLSNPMPANQTATTEIVSFPLWPDPDPNDQAYSIDVELVVTDSATPPAVFTVQRTVQVNNAAYLIAKYAKDNKLPDQLNLTRPGSECLLCGDLDNNVPCTDLDLVLAMTNRCPDTQPYCINDIRAGYGGVTPQNYLFPALDDPSNLVVAEYRRCVDEATAEHLWWEETRGRPECLDQATANQGVIIKSDSGDYWLPTGSTPGAGQLPGVMCSFACYGDGCNVVTYPDEATLYSRDASGTVHP